MELLNDFFPDLKGGKVLSFGELLLRFCPDVEGKWLQQNQLAVNVGGAEANVATALALWEVPSAYFTALPDSILSQQLIGFLQDKNIDTSPVIFQGDRIGTFYLPVGGEMKHAGVIYDRNGSSFYQLKTQTINWDEIFGGISWLHFSAICPALSQNVADVCVEALKAATERGIKISLDLNYRAKLWQYGKQPVEVMPELASYCNLIMGNIWAANQMLGMPLDEELIQHNNQESYLIHAKQSSEAIIGAFPKVKMVANTFRFDHQVAGINYYTTIFDGKTLLQSATYQADKIADKVGSGDCFMAGLIYGFYNKLPLQQILNFATAAAFGKLFIPGDTTKQSVEEITAIIKNHE